MDDATVASFRSQGLKFAGFQIGSRMSSPEDEDRVFGDVSDWLRNWSSDPKGLDDGKLETIADVAGLDMPMPEYKPLDKERTLKDAADWLRHNDLDPNTVDDSTLGALQNMHHAKMSALEKKKFMDSALSVSRWS
jgi:hypothetical protein